MSLKQQKLDEIAKLKEIRVKIESDIDFSIRNKKDNLLPTQYWNLRRLRDALKVANQELDAIVYAQKKKF